MLELPAGSIDEGETAVECAGRELAEETGHVAVGLEHVATLDDRSDELRTARLHLFAGSGARRLHEPNLDPTEEISTESASLAELRRHVSDGTIAVTSHVAAIYIMLDRLGRLGRA